MEATGGRASSAAQPATKAGHAAAWSSSRQPGIAAKVAACSTAPADSGSAVANGGARDGEGSVVQPSSEAASTAASRKRRSDAMAWLLLEAGVALVLAVLIVWLTMGARRKEPPAAAPKSAGRNGADGGQDAS
ncbi:MAG: hypothetical protein ACREX7_10135 [Casimicrobiaceae bacterium]